MSRRPSAPVRPEEAERTASPAIARTDRLDVEVDRPKRIDQYLDYFGERRPFPEAHAEGSSARR